MLFVVSSFLCYMYIYIYVLFNMIMLLRAVQTCFQLFVELGLQIKPQTHGVSTLL